MQLSQKLDLTQKKKIVLESAPPQLLASREKFQKIFVTIYYENI